MSIALRAEGLTKEYRVHRSQATTLKELVVRNAFRKADTFTHRALDGVGFELPRGRSLAIIGGNGSGKSTLLKLITGIIQADAGTLEVNGRVAALLELGAGFQPEFTGMENIFLQCSIMGLTRAQTLRRLDRIIAFSELQKFIHTPVKRYSSGMYVRLGFAIAAHVDADILVLDEVLAVGDQTFQVKCLQEIHELRERGKTVLFVSHSTDHVEAVAEDVLWLKAGRRHAFGLAEEVLPRYYNALGAAREAAEMQQEAPPTLRGTAAVPAARYSGRKASMQDVRFAHADGRESMRFEAGEAFSLRLRVEVREPLEALELTVGFGTMDSLRALWVTERIAGDGAVTPGKYEVEVLVEDHHLEPGRYLVSLLLAPPGEMSAPHDLHIRLYAVTLWREGTRTRLQGEAPRLTPWWRTIPAAAASPTQTNTE